MNKVIAGGLGLLALLALLGGLGALGGSAPTAASTVPVSISAGPVSITVNPAHFDYKLSAPANPVHGPIGLAGKIDINIGASHYADTFGPLKSEGQKFAASTSAVVSGSPGGLAAFTLSVYSKSNALLATSAPVTMVIPYSFKAGTGLVRGQAGMTAPVLLKDGDWRNTAWATVFNFAKTSQNGTVTVVFIPRYDAQTPAYTGTWTDSVGPASSGKEITAIPWGPEYSTEAEAVALEAAYQYGGTSVTTNP